MKKLLFFLFFISFIKLTSGQDLSGDWQQGSPLLNQSQSFYSFDGESDGECQYFPPYGDFNIISCIKGHFHLDSDSITFRLESVVYYTGPPSFIRRSPSVYIMPWHARMPIRSTMSPKGRRSRGS